MDNINASTSNAADTDLGDPTEAEPSFHIDTAGTSPAAERLRRRHRASRMQVRVAAAASLCGILAWILGGAMLFGVAWLMRAGQLLLIGLVCGAVLGVGVFVYSLWIEAKAAVLGNTAVWNIGISELPRKTRARIKLQFAILATLLCGCVGMLIMAILHMFGGFLDNPWRSGSLLAITLVAATLAGLSVRGRSNSAHD